jgi:hypothetical protein
MIEPNWYNFYAFAKSLAPLNELQLGARIDDPNLVQIFRNSTHVADWFVLDEFCQNHMPSSARKLGELKNFVVSRLLNPPAVLGMETIFISDIDTLKKQIHEFETLLQDELSKLPAYVLEDRKIGNLSIRKLLHGASNGYPKDARERLTKECKNEIDESGKCLVFERSTASGFHILRAIEITITQYLTAIPHFVMPALNRQNWGEYLKLLKDNGATREVTDHLHNIKDNYRNPLMHPVDTMNTDQAVSIFGVAQSMNEMLVKDMLDRKLIL